MELFPLENGKGYGVLQNLGIYGKGLSVSLALVIYVSST